MGRPGLEPKVLVRDPSQVSAEDWYSHQETSPSHIYFKATTQPDPDVEPSPAVACTANRLARMLPGRQNSNPLRAEERPDPGASPGYAMKRPSWMPAGWRPDALHKRHHLRRRMNCRPEGSAKRCRGRKTQAPGAHAFRHESIGIHVPFSSHFPASYGAV